MNRLQTGMKYVHSLNKKNLNLSLIQLCELYQNYLTWPYSFILYILPEASGHDSDKLGAPSPSPPRIRSSHQSWSLTSRTLCGGTWQCPEHHDISKSVLNQEHLSVRSFIPSGHSQSLELFLLGYICANHCLPAASLTLMFHTAPYSPHHTEAFCTFWICSVPIVDKIIKWRRKGFYILN